MGKSVLEVKSLRIDFNTIDGVAKVVDGIDLSIQEGDIVGLVGESGCGKSVIAKTILNALPMPPGRIVEGEINLHGESLLGSNVRERRKLISRELAYIPQDPMTSLNPVFTIGEQMTDLIRWQGKERVGIKEIVGMCRGNGSSMKKAIELLDRVNMASPAEVLKRYPMELSGGMKQRILIALSLIGKPSLLIADEPTTALDVTVQKVVLELLEENVREEELSVLYITHALGVAKRLCGRVYVMYGGNIVEMGETTELLNNPLHPYTQGLIDSIPKITGGVFKGIDGRIPDYVYPPSGCRFHPRCEQTMEICRLHKPSLVKVNHSRLVACHLYTTSS